MKKRKVEKTEDISKFDMFDNNKGRRIRHFFYLVHQLDVFYTFSQIYFNRTILLEICEWIPIEYLDRNLDNFFITRYNFYDLIDF